MPTQKKSLIGTSKGAKKVQVAGKAGTKGEKNVSARSVRSARAVTSKRAASFRLSLNHNQILL